MILDLIKKTRSYRRYDPTKPVTREDVAAFVDAARLTGSAGNLQKLRYLPVTDPAEVAWLTRSVKWAAYLSDWEGPGEDEGPSAYLLLLSPHDSGVSGIDVGLSSEALLLAATERGFGGCMILNFPREEIIERYGLSGKYRVELVISLGTPREKVVITEPVEGNIKYYRDGDGVHYVPKRSLSEVLLPEPIPNARTKG